MATSSKLCTTLAMVAAAQVVLSSPATAQGQSEGEPMVVGSDFGIAPWMVRSAEGPEGFGVDMIREIGDRLGRPVEIRDINFAGLFAALFAERIDFTVNPLNITKDRADRMLFTEPFFATGNGFIVREGETMSSLEDLSGKTLAVNRGTISDTWATENADTYGFEVSRYETFPDSVQAVITQRAFTALNEIPTAVYAAEQNQAIELGFRDYTGRNFGYAFRYDSEDYRNRVERVIECMKQDGTLPSLYEEWYGETPEQDAPIRTVYPGFGPLGFKGHDDSEHDLNCG